MNKTSIILFVIAYAIVFIFGCQPAEKQEKEQIKYPNIILIMSDDQGWGDVGYNGHPHLKTPHLDEMASNGAQFNRFYAAAPVCPPTRASVLTGSHPYRMGIHFANVGHIPQQEITLPEILNAEWYATGHFGKWHLRTMNKFLNGKNLRSNHLKTIRTNI